MTDKVVRKISKSCIDLNCSRVQYYSTCQRFFTRNAAAQDTATVTGTTIYMLAPLFVVVCGLEVEPEGILDPGLPECGADLLVEPDVAFDVTVEFGGGVFLVVILVVDVDGGAVGLLLVCAAKVPVTTINIRLCVS